MRPQVVADLVDRLLEGVPQEMRPAFEAAAVLRYFNVEALNALLESGNTRHSMPSCGAGHSFVHVGKDWPFTTQCAR